MSKAMVCFFTVAWLASCQPEKSRTGQTPPENAAASPYQCYTWGVGESTAKARIRIDSGKVNGTLDFDYAEKDDSKGNLAGTLNNDIILADYTFTSEGQKSVMEVVFRVEGNKLIQGFAEMEERDGKVVFKDPVKLSFGNEFVRTDCE